MEYAEFKSKYDHRLLVLDVYFSMQAYNTIQCNMVMNISKIKPHLAEQDQRI